MTATDKDFQYLSEDGRVVYLSDQWPLLTRAVRSLFTVFREKIVTGTEPEDYLLGWYFSDGSTNRKYLRLQYNSGTGEFLISKNTATETSPSWTDLFKINISSSLVTLPGSLSVTGSLTGGAHGSNHLPNGSDSLTTASAVDITNANAVGTANSLARSDHTHRGVASLDANSSGSLVYGAANFAGTGLTTVSKTGQNFTVNSQLTTIIDTDNTLSGPTTVSSMTALSSFGNLALTGADGSKIFYASFNITGTNTAGTNQTATIRVHIGALGTVSDPVNATFKTTVLASGGRFSFSFSNLKLVPASGHKLTISGDTTSGALNMEFAGGNSTPEHGTLTVFSKGN